MKKAIVVANIVIQLLWYAISGVATYFVVRTWFDGINQPWRSILGGLVFIAIVALITIVTNMFKAAKDPDLQAASQYHITVSQYRKFKILFNSLLNDEMMNEEDVKKLLHDVLIEKPKEWKAYCLSRENEYKPFYNIGKEVFAFNKENKKYVKGIITNISFGIEWWYYTIEFAAPISINNRWPSQKVNVLAKTIMDIETNRIGCYDSHYIF